MKVVVNGIYETNKTRVQIGKDTVTKTFIKKGSHTRFQREVKSLQRLRGSDYFPNLIAFDSEEKSIKMNPLPGIQPKKLTASQINILRGMVDYMHNAGVARHAMPIRDLLCSDDQDLGMVDFERVTLRHARLSPMWIVAKKVSYYHLYRTIQQHQPSLLSDDERKLVFRINRIRHCLQKLRPVKEKFKTLADQIYVILPTR